LHVFSIDSGPAGDRCEAGDEGDWQVVHDGAAESLI
jgi:hypothetical protein